MGFFDIYRCYSIKAQTFFPYFFRRISPMPNTPFPWPEESAPAYTLFPRTWLRSNTKWSWLSSHASCPKITCQIWTPRKRPLRPLMGIRSLPRRRHRRRSRRLRTCITKRPTRRKTQWRNLRIFFHKDWFLPQNHHYPHQGHLCLTLKFQQSHFLIGWLFLLQF